MDANRRRFAETLCAELQRSYGEYAQLRDRIAAATQGAAEARREILRLLEELDAESRIGYAS